MAEQSSEKSSAADRGPKSLRGVDAYAAKKPYYRPSLECYGRLTDVTQTGGSLMVDSGNLGLLP